MVHHKKERESTNNSNPNEKGDIAPSKIIKEYFY